MKNLILDKNFCNEVKDVSKEDLKISVVYPGRFLNGEEFKLYNKEDGKIAPIVRFLVEGRKKNNWILILIAIFLFIIFLGIIIFLFYPKSEAKPVNKELIMPVGINTTIKTNSGIIENNITEQITGSGIDNSKEQLYNEVDMMKDLKNQSELATMQLNFDLQRVQIELADKVKENEKLNLQIANLQKEIEEKNKKIEEKNLLITGLSSKEKTGVSDDFLYYLGQNFYTKCETTKDKTIIDNCKTLYFNYLEYDKNR